MEPELRHRNVFGDRNAVVNPLLPPTEPGYRIRAIQKYISQGIPEGQALSGYQRGGWVDADEAQMHYLTTQEIYPTPSRELGVMLRDYGIPWLHVDAARRMIDNYQKKRKGA